MRKIVFTIVYMCLCQQLPAQEQKTAEQVLAEMDSPTFVPTVKVGKVLHEGDSIQYMEMNNVYVYPELTFKNKKQAQSYMRLVNNVKKVLPIAKEARQMLIETTEFLDMLPDEKSKNEHIKRDRPRVPLFILRDDQGLYGSDQGRFLAGVCLGLRCVAEEGIRSHRHRPTDRTGGPDGRSRPDLSYPTVANLLADS